MVGWTLKDVFIFISTINCDAVKLIDDDQGQFSKALLKAQLVEF